MRNEIVKPKNLLKKFLLGSVGKDIVSSAFEVREGAVERSKFVVNHTRSTWLKFNSREEVVG